MNNFLVYTNFTDLTNFADSAFRFSENGPIFINDGRLASPPGYRWALDNSQKTGVNLSISGYFL